MMQKLGIVVAVLVVAAGGYFGYRHFHQNGTAAPQNTATAAGGLEKPKNNIFGKYSPQLATAREMSGQLRRSMKAMKRHVQQFGSWRYLCNERPNPANSPPIQNILSVAPAPATDQMAGKCSISTRTASADLKQWNLLFMRFDEPDKLTVGLRYPMSGDSGDFINVLFDNTPVSLSAMFCHKACLASTQIPAARANAVFGAQRIVATLPVPQGQKPITVAFPVDGLKDAAGALQKQPRLDSGG